MNGELNQNEVITYVNDNPLIVLGTVGEDGVPHGAAVYAIATMADQLYFVTKTETQKYKDILLNPNVSVTIVNVSENSSLQGAGQVEIQDDPQIIEMVMKKMNSIYAQVLDWLPPIAKLRAGAYQIVGIKLHYARLARFKGKDIGSKNIFRESTT